jgi:p24 family protein alpha
MLIRLLFSVIVIQQFVSLYSEALYFHIRETERKCFIEEVPDETLVVGKYKVQLFDKNSNDYLPATQGMGMHVEVKDPEQKVILSKVI